MSQELNSEETVTQEGIMEMTEEELNKLIEDMSPDPPTLDDIIRQRDYVAQRNIHRKVMFVSALSFCLASVSVFLVISTHLAKENEWSLAASNWILMVALLILLIFGTIIVYISNVVARMLQHFSKKLRSWMPWIKN